MFAAANPFVAELDARHGESVHRRIGCWLFGVFRRRLVYCAENDADRVVPFPPLPPCNARSSSPQRVLSPTQAATSNRENQQARQWKRTSLPSTRTIKEVLWRKNQSKKRLRTSSSSNSASTRSRSRRRPLLLRIWARTRWILSNW